MYFILIMFWLFLYFSLGVVSFFCFCFFHSVCDCYVHAECQEFAASNCRECATYTAGKEGSSSQLTQCHHWTEGNLPNNSKCALCRKSCWSSECLSGYRCAWCTVTVRLLLFPKAIIGLRVLSIESFFSCLIGSFVAAFIKKPRWNWFRGLSFLNISYIDWLIYRLIRRAIKLCRKNVILDRWRG